MSFQLRHSAIFRLVLGWALAFLALPAFHTLNAQSRDTEVWTNVETSIEILKHTELGFKQSLRLNDNVADFKLTHSTVGLQYEVSKLIRLGVAYRLTLRDDASPQHAVLGDLRLRFDLSPFKWSYRIRYHHEDRREKSAERHLRQKVGVKLRGKSSLRPFLAGELFYRFRETKADEFDKIRYFMGLELELNKTNEIEFFFLFQNELNSKDPSRATVFGISYGLLL